MAGVPRSEALAPNAFPAERRIRKRPDFVRVQEGGARVSTKSFIFLVAARDEGAPSRLGITATRKFGNAVARNRAKRVAREVFRLHPDVVPAGVDVVVVVRGEAARLGLTAVAAEWAAAAPALARAAASAKRGLAKPESRPHTAQSRPERTARQPQSHPGQQPKKP